MADLERRPSRSIVILRALQLGDLLCAVPAFRAMRAAWPAARLTLVGLPWARAFVDRFASCLDDFVEFPGWPGLPEREPDREGWPRCLAAIASRRPDLALQMQGDGSITNDLVARFGAAGVAGFVRRGDAPPAPGLFVEYPDDRHEIRRMLALTAALGVAPRGEHLEFPLSGDDEREAAGLRERLGLAPGSYACLHPGARAEARRWPPAHFARVGECLIARGLDVIVTGDGPLEERLAAEVVAEMEGRARSVAGRTSLGALAALVRDARLVACNDTGLSHVAAAVGTPSVVVFRITEPSRWAPLDSSRHRVVHDGPHAVDEAVTAAAALLAGEASHAA